MPSGKTAGDEMTAGVISDIAQDKHEHTAKGDLCQAPNFLDNWHSLPKHFPQIFLLQMSVTLDLVISVLLYFDSLNSLGEGCTALSSCRDFKFKL